MTENKKVVCHDKDGNQFNILVKELSFRPSVYGVIIKDDKILLTTQWDGYDFPGGGIDLGERTEAALKREVKEETGLDVKVGDIVMCDDTFYKMDFSKDCVHSILIYYLCTIIGGEISIDYLEDYEKEYMGMPEWVDIADIGKIKFYNPINNSRLINEAVKLKNLHI